MARNARLMRSGMSVDRWMINKRAKIIAGKEMFLA